jgi:hypothetical protein
MATFRADAVRRGSLNVEQRCRLKVFFLPCGAVLDPLAWERPLNKEHLAIDMGNTSALMVERFNGRDVLRWRVRA